MLSPALVPVYTTSRPGKMVRLWAGTIGLEDRASSVRGRGAIGLRLTPDSHIAFRLAGPLPYMSWEVFGDDAQLVFPGAVARAGALVTSVESSSARRTTYSGRVRGAITVGDGHDLRRALIHIFNFPTYVGDAVHYSSGAFGASRVVLVGGGWRITIDAIEGAGGLTQSLQRDGGYAITHIAEVVREDGSTFDSTDLADAVDVLGYVLTFARSAWSFPLLSVGYGSGPQPQWQEWADRRLDSWTGRLTWYDHNGASALAAVFAGMWPIWLDPSRQSVLHVALGFGVEAHSDVSVEGRLVMSQAALELLAWQRLVNEKRMSNREFNAMSAEEQVRQLLKVSRVDPALPNAAAFLASATSIGSPLDGPAAVTQLRNRIVHPPRSSHHALIPSEVLVAGWRLSLTYLHIALLGWFGYTGSFISAVDLAPRVMSSGEVHQ